MIHLHHLRLGLGGGRVTLCLYIFNFIICKHMCNMKKVDLWGVSYIYKGFGLSNCRNQYVCPEFWVFRCRQVAERAAFPMVGLSS